MSRVPLRVRLTAAFASAELVVLAGCALFRPARGRPAADRAHRRRGLALRRERVASAELLESTAERFRQRANERGRTIRLGGRVDATAELDPLRARQALGNLVDNALRHGDGDGDVATEAGKRVEVTDDWYAQDSKGNVWYLGEATTSY